MLNFNYEEKPEYLSVEFSGSYDLKEMEKVMKEVLVLCASNDKQKLFVDAANVQGSPGTIDRLKFSRGIRQLDRKGVKISILAKPPLVDPRNVGEMVASNRDIEYGIFETENQALAWLLG